MKKIEGESLYDPCPVNKGDNRAEGPNILEVKILAPTEYSCEEDRKFHGTIKRYLRSGEEYTLLQ